MAPQISVIIPAHNEESYLGETLKSLREQNFLDYETLIICNGCTDKTEEVAKGYINQNTKIFSKEKANVSIARNFGAEKALGKLLFFLDADTLLESDSLKKISERFKEEYSVATTKTKPDSLLLKYRLALAFKNFNNQTGLYCGSSGNIICRKEDFHKVGGYEEIKVREQRKLIIKLKKLGKYAVIPTYATTSMRRFKEWGLLKAMGFWIKQSLKDYTSDLKKEEYETIR